MREEIRFIRATHDSLIATLDDPAVRDGMRCGTLTFPTYRLVPDAKWHLPDATIGARSAQRRDRGVEVFALGQKALRRYGFAAGTSPSVNLPTPGVRARGPPRHPCGVRALLTRSKAALREGEWRCQPFLARLRPRGARLSTRRAVPGDRQLRAWAGG